MMSQRPKRFRFVFFAFVLLFTGFASLSQPAVAQGDSAFYCDFGNQPAGSVAQWWANEGVAPDCIDLTVTNSPETCSLQATFFSYVTLKDGSKVDRLYWSEVGGTGAGNSSTGFTISFPEGYNGGSVTVRIGFNSPETDIQVGLSDSDKDHWFSIGGGVEYTVNTSCQQTQVEWCSPGYWKHHTDAWPVSTATTYASVFGADPVDKKGQTVTGATLLDVISRLQAFGGPTAEQVASYLSGQAGMSGTIPDGSLPVVCPLN